jgi:hypothetical protein
VKLTLAQHPGFPVRRDRTVKDGFPLQAVGFRPGAGRAGQRQELAGAPLPAGARIDVLGRHGKHGGRHDQEQDTAHPYDWEPEGGRAKQKWEVNIERKPEGM